MSNRPATINVQRSKAEEDAYRLSRPFKKRKLLFKLDELLANRSERPPEDFQQCLSPLSPVCSYGLSTPSIPGSPNLNIDGSPSDSGISDPSLVVHGGSPPQGKEDGITSTDRLNLIKTIATIEYGIESRETSPFPSGSKDEEPKSLPRPVPVLSSPNSPGSGPWRSFGGSFMPSAGSFPSRSTYPLAQSFSQLSLSGGNYFPQFPGSLPMSYPYLMPGRFSPLPIFSPCTYASGCNDLPHTSPQRPSKDKRVSSYAMQPRKQEEPKKADGSWPGSEAAERLRARNQGPLNLEDALETSPSEEPVRTKFSYSLPMPQLPPPASMG